MLHGVQGPKAHGCDHMLHCAQGSNAHESHKTAVCYVLCCMSETTMNYNAVIAHLVNLVSEYFKS